MKERPIPFTAEMVRAILGGRKTQTRRLSGLVTVNVLPDLWEIKHVGTLDWMTARRYRGRFGAYFHSEKIEPRTLSVCPVACPYGEPGDRLWAKETLVVERNTTRSEIECGHFTYKADDKAGLWTKEIGFRTIPSIFMPKWASRIMLEVVRIRVERVQEIGLGDINAEGTPDTLDPRQRPYGSRREQFQRLWDSINAKRGYRWEFNPWVWVVDFRLLNVV